METQITSQKAAVEPSHRHSLCSRRYRPLCRMWRSELRPFVISVAFEHLDLLQVPSILPQLQQQDIDYSVWGDPSRKKAQITTQGGISQTQRRALLALLLFTAPSAVTCNWALGAPVLEVGPQSAFHSISQAVEAAASGAIILVSPGLYQERLLLSKAIYIRAAGPQESQVIVEWRTKSPYESVVQCSATGVKLEGLFLRHSSPSVANNYAVYVQGGALEMADCDISSATGSGIGVEGGELTLARSAVHDCARHGIALFTDLEGQGGKACVNGCRIQANKLNGVLAREDTELELCESSVLGNGEFGIYLKDCRAMVMQTSMQSNGKGPAFISRLAEVNAEQLSAANELNGSILRR